MNIHLHTYAFILAAVLLAAACGAECAPKKGDPFNDPAIERGEYWSQWIREANGQCPGNQVQWEGMSEASIDLAGGFKSTLSRTEREKVDRNLNTRCLDQPGDLSCLFAVYLRAYSRTGLMKRFAAYSCRTLDCGPDEICRPRH